MTTDHPVPIDDSSCADKTQDNGQEQVVPESDSGVELQQDGVQDDEFEDDDQDDEDGQELKNKNKKQAKKRNKRLPLHLVRMVKAAGGTLSGQDSDSDEEDDPPFETKIFEKKDPATGQVIERNAQVTIKDPDLVVILKNGGMKNEELYDEHPKIMASELISFLPQLKTTHEQYLNQYNHHIAQKSIAPLIKFLEKEYSWLTSRLETMTKEGQISFQHLWYLFPKGSKAFTTYESEVVGFEVGTTRYQKTMFAQQFVIQGEIIQTDGRKFFTMKKNFAIQAFDGTTSISGLNVKPMDDNLYKNLTERGRRFFEYGIGNHYLHYTGTIFRKNWFYTTKYAATGRVMVDCVSFQRMNPDYMGDFRSQDSYDEMGNPIESGFDKIAEERLYMCWPFTRMFSFTSKKWGEGAIRNLKPIKFDTGAFDRLVLPPEKKMLIKALVENGGSAFTDIISGKGGGTIFLLHGTPGTGKTLTAESLAELLQRPLYSISVGELGTNTNELEDRLREILEVSQTWQAIVLIDEADIFLERRTERDIERNALVGIFLRLLEYHQGILMLTTNRVQTFDEAFKSRISIALKYDDLDSSARKQIWSNFLEIANISLTGEDVDRLASFELNGRQIKNILRLTQSLADSEGKPASMSHFERCISISQQFDEITSGSQ